MTIVDWNVDVVWPKVVCTNVFSALVRFPVHSLTSRGHSHGHSHSFCSILKNTAEDVIVAEMNVYRLILFCIIQ